MGTRQRSTSRLCWVMGLTGLSGQEYWTGLCAAPLMGLRRVTLKNNGIHILIIESEHFHHVKDVHLPNIFYLFFFNLFILSLMQQVRVSTGFVWYLLDPCRSGLTVWKDVLESIFHRFLGRLEKTVKMSEITQMKPETVKTGALHFKQN